MDRFQGHFGSVSRKEKNTLITDHCTSADHNGIQDMNIHILDFVHMNGKTDAAKKASSKTRGSLDSQAWAHLSLMV